MPTTAGPDAAGAPTALRADVIRQGARTVFNEVALNQVLVSFGPATRTDAVIAAVQADGTCWRGPTTWQGHRAMRVSVSGWSTSEDDSDASIAAVLARAGRVR